MFTGGLPCPPYVVFKTTPQMKEIKALKAKYGTQKDTMGWGWGLGKGFYSCWSASGHHFNCDLYDYLKLEFGVLEFCFLLEAVASVFFPSSCWIHRTRSVDHPMSVQGKGGGGVMVSEVKRGDGEASWTPRALASSLRHLGAEVNFGKRGFIPWPHSLLVTSGK